MSWRNFFRDGERVGIIPRPSDPQAFHGEHAGGVLSAVCSRHGFKYEIMTDGVTIRLLRKHEIAGEITIGVYSGGSLAETVENILKEHGR